MQDGETLGTVNARHHWFDDLLSRARTLPAVSVAVVYPCSPVVLNAAVDVAEDGLLHPVLLGPEETIRSLAAQCGRDLSLCKIVCCPDAKAASEYAVQLVHDGTVSLIMKGALHTDMLLHAVLQHENGLRTGRRVSHVFVMDVPAYPRPLLVTDGVVNIAPDLACKADILRNAVALAHTLGLKIPKVAVLSAVETVTAALPSTIDAAALSKMADRGQITGALVDGPLAFDNAINMDAAREKEIVSPVAGQADVLLVPDIEAGNMLAKQLTFLAGADAAGIVLGAKVPIILTSRADSERARVLSCVLGRLVAEDQATGHS